jgi:hypothetical protein
MQRSVAAGRAWAGAFGAGVLVASLSAIGRLGDVVAGGSVSFTGAASGPAEDGAAAGTAVRPSIGTFRSSVGADAVPQAAVVSAITSRLKQTLFMVI